MIRCLLGPLTLGRANAIYVSTAYNQGVTTSPIRKVAEANFPTRWGQFRIYGFQGEFDGRTEEAVALVMGDIHA